ncbi:hypothetical protein SAMN05421539_11291 [Jannaschia seohaensis]|uniref:Uncharacterized protein n=1 Tax=Jannaschia seohaensis TaxID=475081 RepID=A0A2Y9B3Z7_9RHOB|nr:hypothetical protein BCF38_11291 [Jannaschia seohaensis]SSA50218.1 hypothetical protein SAMN05421539_11291 [Jannaschia seohaensis]
MAIRNIPSLILDSVLALPVMAQENTLILLQISPPGNAPGNTLFLDQSNTIQSTVAGDELGLPPAV